MADAGGTPALLDASRKFSLVPAGQACTIPARPMKALVKAKAEPGLWLQDVPEPDVGPMDVLIKIHKTSICGTDVHIWKWDAWAQRTIPVPMHVGHEFCGVVEAVGSGVTDVVPSELVSGEGHIVCGRCRNCLAGRRHLCPETQGVGVNRPGAFAEYLSIPYRNVYKVDPSIPEEVISTFDPMGPIRLPSTNLKK